MAKINDNINFNFKKMNFKIKFQYVKNHSSLHLLTNFFFCGDAIAIDIVIDFCHYHWFLNSIFAIAIEIDIEIALLCN